MLMEYYRYDNHKLRTGGSHPLLGSLELTNQIASPYFMRLPMFDVDHAETDPDSGISMCRLVANDFSSMPECGIPAFMAWVVNLSEKHSETAMVRTSDAKQERRMELTLLRVPQKKQ